MGFGKNHISNNYGTMVKITRFHGLILTSFCLIFFGACGYKANPTYTIEDINASTKEVKEYRQIDRW